MYTVPVLNLVQPNYSRNRGKVGTGTCWHYHLLDSLLQFNVVKRGCIHHKLALLMKCQCCLNETTYTITVQNGLVATVVPSCRWQKQGYQAPRSAHKARAVQSSIPVPSTSQCDLENQLNRWKVFDVTLKFVTLLDFQGKKLVNIIEMLNMQYLVWHGQYANKDVNSEWNWPSPQFKMDSTRQAPLHCWPKLTFYLETIIVFHLSSWLLCRDLKVMSVWGIDFVAGTTRAVCIAERTLYTLARTSVIWWKIVRMISFVKSRSKLEVKVMGSKVLVATNFDKGLATWYTHVKYEYSMIHLLWLKSERPSLG